MNFPASIVTPNGIKLVKIPKGNGYIGDGGFFGFFVKPRNGPKIEVNLNHDFYMAETCITSEQWLSLESRDPSRFTFDPTCPVESVSRAMALSYIEKLNKIEMNRKISDILFSRLNEAEIISFQKTNNLQESIEKYENEIANSFAASELIQVIKNKLIFLGVDLTKISLNNIKTPLAFSDFIQTISRCRIELKNSGFL